MPDSNSFLSKYPEFRGELSAGNLERWIDAHAELFQGHHVHELGGDGMMGLAAVDAGALTAQVASERVEDVERVLDVVGLYDGLKGKLGHVIEDPVIWVLNYPRQFWRGVWFLDQSICEGWDLPKVFESIGRDRPALVVGCSRMNGSEAGQSIHSSFPTALIELVGDDLIYIYSERFIRVIVQKFFGDDYWVEFGEEGKDRVTVWKIARNGAV